MAETVYHWARTGMGAWAGWSFSWAAILYARLGSVETAVNLLRLWKDSFTNEGRGTLHDSRFVGVSALGENLGQEKPARLVEIVQMDAGFGALAAVFELFVQEREGGLWIFPGLPIRWRNYEFEGIRVPGCFFVSGKVEGGRVASVRLDGEKAGKVRVRIGPCRYDGVLKRWVEPEWVEVRVREGECWEWNAS